MCGLSSVAVSGGYSLLLGEGFLSQRLLLLQGIDCRLTGSVVVVHMLGCSEACGIFLDQELNPCLLN